MEYRHSRARPEDRNRSAESEELDGNELSLLGGTDQFWGQPRGGGISGDDRVLKLTRRHSGMRASANLESRDSGFARFTRALSDKRYALARGMTACIWFFRRILPMYHFTALVTCLAILFYFFTSVWVVRARGAYGIGLPAISGNPDF